MSKQEDLQFWANALKENDESIRPLRHKMHNKIDTLTYEELFMLRELLVRNGSLVTLLNETMAWPDPKPRWKKFFRK